MTVQRPYDKIIFGDCRKSKKVVVNILAIFGFLINTSHTSQTALNSLIANENCIDHTGPNDVETCIIT